jgi:hypothetical protein
VASRNHRWTWSGVSCFMYMRQLTHIQLATARDTLQYFCFGNANRPAATGWFRSWTFGQRMLPNPHRDAKTLDRKRPPPRCSRPKDGSNHGQRMLQVTHLCVLLKVICPRARYMLARRVRLRDPLPRRTRKVFGRGPKLVLGKESTPIGCGAKLGRESLRPPGAGVVSEPR